MTGLSPAENAADFVALIIGSSSSWGIRLGDILTNIALVVAAHRLSVFEIMRCLRQPEYLERLLECPPAGKPTAAYQEAAEALTYEFLAGSKSIRTEAASAVTNKIRETLRSDFLRDLLTARVNTLDLSRLWKRQGVVLVHLDRASLGEAGARLLAGLVTGSLFRTSLRVTGPVPVTCSLDEISTTARFVGETLEEIATFSRSANLRLIAASQNLSQTSGPLREALLSAAVQISFRLSPGDARLVAASFAAGTEPSVARVHAASLPASRQNGQVPRSIWRHPLRNASGRPLRLDAATWDRLRWEDMFRLSEMPGSSGREDPFREDSLGAVSRLAAQYGASRLYVRAADTGKSVEVHRYVAGLSPHAYWVEGPQPLTLAVSFPTPRLTGPERRGEADAARAWTRVLQSQPQRHAVLRVGGGEPVPFRVADVPDASGAGLGPYLAASLQANGQSIEEIGACARQRSEDAFQLVQGNQAASGALKASGALNESGAEAGNRLDKSINRGAKSVDQHAQKELSDEKTASSKANGAPLLTNGLAVDGSLD